MEDHGSQLHTNSSPRGNLTCRSLLRRLGSAYTTGVRERKEVRGVGAAAASDTGVAKWGRPRRRRAAVGVLNSPAMRTGLISGLGAVGGVPAPVLLPVPVLGVALCPLAGSSGTVTHAEAKRTEGDSGTRVG